MSSKSDFPQVSFRRIITAVAIGAIGIVAVASLGGCSTVSGFADLVGGVARDIKDGAEGTRDRNTGMGSWSGVYGGN